LTGEGGFRHLQLQVLQLLQGEGMAVVTVGAQQPESRPLRPVRLFKLLLFLQPRGLQRQDSRWGARLGSIQQPLRTR
jgi:hypothetical protein